MSFEKPKVFIDYDEYEYLKQLLDKQDPNAWISLEYNEPVKGMEFYVSDGENYDIGKKEYGQWHLKGTKYFTPTHFSNINPCPKKTVIDNDDLPF